MIRDHTSNPVALNQSLPHISSLRLKLGAHIRPGLIEALLPLLKKQTEAAIVKITSNVAFHPLVVLPTYSDAKTALHSHSVALRLTLSSYTYIKVFEVMPSLINTDATKNMGANSMDYHRK